MNNFDSINEMIDSVRNDVHDYVLLSGKMKRVSSVDLGLDARAAYSLFIEDDYIAVTNAGKDSLNYYGGFEYIDKDFVTVIGEFTFYSAEHERVRDCLDHYIMIETE
jgi:hypothetical protein